MWQQLVLVLRTNCCSTAITKMIITMMELQPGKLSKDIIKTYVVITQAPLWKSIHSITPNIYYSIQKLVLSSPTFCRLLECTWRSSYRRIVTSKQSLELMPCFQILTKIEYKHWNVTLSSRDAYRPFKRLLFHTLEFYRNWMLTVYTNLDRRISCTWFQPIYNNSNNNNIHSILFATNYKAWSNCWISFTNQRTSRQWTRTRNHHRNWCMLAKIYCSNKCWHRPIMHSTKYRPLLWSCLVYMDPGENLVHGHGLGPKALYRAQYWRLCITIQRLRAKLLFLTTNHISTWRMPLRPCSQPCNSKREIHSRLSN